ncbi:MAG: Trm112 family protein [Nanoarchaeota archaeon]
MIDEDVLKIIACPKCKNDLRIEGNALKCKLCSKVYKIEENTPILLD